MDGFVDAPLSCDVLLSSHIVVSGLSCHSLISALVVIVK